MTGSRSEGLDAPGSLSAVLRFSVFLECLSTLYYFDASSCVPRFSVSFFFFIFYFYFDKRCVDELVKKPMPEIGLGKQKKNITTIVSVEGW